MHYIELLLSMCQRYFFFPQFLQLRYRVGFNCMSYCCSVEYQLVCCIQSRPDQSSCASAKTFGRTGANEQQYLVGTGEKSCPVKVQDIFIENSVLQVPKRVQNRRKTAVLWNDVGKLFWKNKWADCIEILMDDWERWGVFPILILSFNTQK